MDETARDKKFYESIVSACTDYIQPSKRELLSLFTPNYTANSSISENKPFYGKFYFDINGIICEPGNGYFSLDFAEYSMFHIGFNPRFVRMYNFNTVKFVDYINILGNNTKFTTSNRLIFLFDVRMAWILLTKWVRKEYIYTQEMSDIILNNTQFVKNIY